MIRLIKIAFKSFPKLSLFVLVFTVFTVLLQLPMPLLTVYFLDTILPSKNISLLNTFGIILLAFLFLEVSSGFINRYLNVYLYEKIVMKYSILSFENYLNSDYLSSITKSTGYWANRIQNEPQSFGNLVKTFIDILTQSLTLIVGIFFIFYFSYKLGLLVLILLPFYIWSLFFFTPKIRKQNKIIKEEKSKLTGFIEESLSGFEILKVLSAEKKRQKELESKWDKVVKENVRYTIIVSLASLLASVIASFAPIGVLWYGGYLVIIGSLTIGKLVGINRFLSYVFKPIASLININANIQDALISLQRMDEIINLPKEQKGGKDILISSNASIKIENLVFSYKSDNNFQTYDEIRNKIFNNFNLEIQGGKVTAIVGDSGCGKSTLLRLIVGLLKKDSGNILIDDIPINEINIVSLRNQIILIPQNSYLFSENLGYNITLGTNEKEIDKALLDVTGISKFLNGYLSETSDLNNLDIGSRGLKLSGGQRQRIALARALIKDPPILLMDEVTSEIDLETEKEIIESIIKLRENKTTVIVAHRISAVRKADEIIVLSSNGNIIERGTHDYLINQKGKYYNLCTVSN